MRNGEATSPLTEGGDAPGRRRRLGEPGVATCVALVGVVAAFFQLFWGEHIGLADNGDGFRLMCHFDLARRVDVLQSRVVLHYAPVTYGCRPEVAYVSSQQWLAWPVVRAYQLRYESGFDLRALGVLHSALFGLLLAALYRALPGPRRARVVAVVVAGVLLADVAFVAYFVSPFSEPAAFLGLLAVVAATAWYVRAAGTPWLPLVLLTLATVFLVLAKSQTFVFALLVVPVLLSRTVETRMLSGPWRGRVAPAAAGVVLLATAAGNLLQQPSFFAEVNNHNLVFHTLLVDSPDPESVLRSLGVAEDLVRYRGTGYFALEPRQRDVDAQYQQFHRQVDRRDLLVYLATQPRHWPQLLGAGAEAVSELRPEDLSNYPTPRPRDDRLAPRPNPTERLLGWLAPVSWPLLPVVWLAALVAGALALFRRSMGTEGRALGAACYLLGAAALSQVVIAVVGDGYYELVKHTVLSGYATALLLAVGAGALASALGRRLPRRRADEAAAGEEPAERQAQERGKRQRDDDDRDSRPTEANAHVPPAARHASPPRLPIV
ncbi:MAG: hypothetical protein KY452_09900 [Actinobacteria bacterium]|nr:hypothetical protein [Actinomycetota bacterium]